MISCAQAATEHREELDAMPIDKEVEEADKKAKIRTQHYEKATEWEGLPTSAKFLLLISMLFMIISCYMVQLLTCFVPYELTDRVRDLKGNHWYNLIVWPIGWVACGFFVVSCLLFSGFSTLASRHASKIKPSIPDNEEKLSQLE